MTDNVNIYADNYRSADIMSSDRMSSPQANMARQKSEEVMEALRKNDGSADELMARKENKSSSGGGFKGWLKSKLGPGNGENGHGKPEKSSRGRKSEETGGIEGLKGNSGGLGVEDSSPGLVLGDTAPKGDVLARDGGKGDGVIR